MNRATDEDVRAMVESYRARRPHEFAPDSTAMRAAADTLLSRRMPTRDAAKVEELIAAVVEYNASGAAIKEAKYATGKMHWKPLGKNAPELLRHRAAIARKDAALADLFGVTD